MENRRKMSTRTMVTGSLLTALVVLLQFVSMAIRTGTFSITLSLVPIVIGAVLCGKGMGAWLGFVFGVTVLLSGDAGAFLAINVPGTIITVLVKGILAGLAVDVLYSLLNRINRYLAVIISAVICPVVNTGIFLLGCKLFFWDTIEAWSAGSEYGSDVMKYVIFLLVGGNFIFELLVNVVMSPTITRVIDVGEKSRT